MLDLQFYSVSMSCIWVGSECSHMNKSGHSATGCYNTSSFGFLLTCRNVMEASQKHTHVSTNSIWLTLLCLFVFLVLIAC